MKGMEVMIKQKLVPIPKEILKSPLRLLLFMISEVCKAFLVSLCGFICFTVTIFLLLIAVITKSNLLLSILTCFPGIILLTLLAISTEEFFHAASCIARGKIDTIDNIMIGYYDKNGRNISALYVAVAYYGNFNQIDRLYISSAGPLTTFVILVVLIILSFIFPADNRVCLLLLLVSFIPLIGLIPNSLIIQSDGYNILDASKKMHMPGHTLVFKMLESIVYPLKYCVKADRDFKNDFINPAEAYREIEKSLEGNNLKGAIDIYERLVLINPYDILVLNNLAWLYFKEGMPEKALAFSKKSIRLAPEDPDVKDTYFKLKAVLDIN